MIAAQSGEVEAFRLLVYSGVDFSISNKYRETALTLSEGKCNREVFEDEMIMLDYALEYGSHETYWHLCFALCSTTRRLGFSPKAGKHGIWCSGKRNVVCLAVDVKGPSLTFLGNRLNTYSDMQSGLFHILTTQNR